MVDPYGTNGVGGTIFLFLGLWLFNDPWLDPTIVIGPPRYKIYRIAFICGPLMDPTPWARKPIEALFQRANTEERLPCDLLSQLNMQRLPPLCQH